MEPENLLPLSAENIIQLLKKEFRLTFSKKGQDYFAAKQEIKQLGYQVGAEENWLVQAENNREKKLLCLVMKVYQHNLHSIGGKKIRAYLKQKRQLNFSTIQQFALGCSVNHQQLTNLFSASEAAQQLFSFNLLRSKENNKISDFFGENQLIIPLRDESGEINYQKSKLLYNYFHVRQVEEDFCYLVEGFFDVISLTQKGINNCLALLGTSLSKQQLSLIKKLKKKVILFLDGDSAGKQATIKVALALLNYNIECEIINHSLGLDPDEICQQKSEELTSILQKKEDPYSYILQHFAQIWEIRENPQSVQNFIDKIANLFKTFSSKVQEFLIEKIRKKLIFEVDQLATKSEKSVLCRYGNTVVLTVLCLKQSVEVSNLNFVPLTIFFEEKFYSVGKIPAVFSKREGKPDYNSVTIARLIDRSLRSFFPLGNQHEIQITNTSELTSFNQLLTTVVVGKSQEKLICNPSIMELDDSAFELIITATEKNIVMVELEAEEMAEKELEKAINFAQAQIKQIIHFFQQVANSLKVQKKLSSIPEKKLQTSLQALKEEYINQKISSAEEIEKICDLVLQKWIKANFHQTQQRLDGRKKDAIRPLCIQTDYLPNVHGSALFQRGDTQHFIHHYNFPAFAVNEIAGFKSLSRREIGHGQLVEKTFPPLLPTIDKFPYTIRVVSEVLSSDGSSSQAAICATTLALMAAGIPLQRPVAGIALGLLEKEILVDINGLEDKFGEMDFKIAGTEKGICSLQLDVKNQGIAFSVFQESLQVGKKARLYLLQEMKKCLPKVRDNLPTQAIKFKKFFIGTDRFGLIIGSQGKTINRLIHETGVEIDLQPNGFALLYHSDEQQLVKVIQFIKAKLEKK
ncbi:17012_t:CDS:2 [Funneliformis caledonium]|uniref:Polynucleotide phosphorylase 1 n=1 Tax=Funneliformis caledonium TaxID=1117310 RepID=A0A9N9CGK6_9GLOM|nr:17012_t:CDS:2 [Funneliformis caledonium]